MRAPVVVVVVVLAAVALAGVGCATPSPHVSIPRAPAEDAPYDQRAAYYKTYSLDSREPDHMFLHGGDRVYWPEDLLPAVDDQSPAAMAIRDHVNARKKVEEYQWLAAGSGYVASASLVLALGMLVPLVLPLDDKTQETAVLGLGGASLAALLGGTGMILVDLALVGGDADVAGEAADRAARTYPQALSDRLGVGVDANGNIVDHAHGGPAVVPNTPASTPGKTSGTGA